MGFSIKTQNDINLKGGVLKVLYDSKFSDENFIELLSDTGQTAIAEINIEDVKALKEYFEWLHKMLT